MRPIGTLACQFVERQSVSQSFNGFTSLSARSVGPNELGLLWYISGMSELSVSW